MWARNNKISGFLVKTIANRSWEAVNCGRNMAYRAREAGSRWILVMNRRRSWDAGLAGRDQETT